MAGYLENGQEKKEVHCMALYVKSTEKTFSDNACVKQKVSINYMNNYRYDVFAKFGSIIKIDNSVYHTVTSWRYLWKDKFYRNIWNEEAPGRALRPTINDKIHCQTAKFAGK